MAEKKKSIIDEAVADAKRIQETLNANTKEILRSIAKEEITDIVKESLNEFEEEDVDDTEVATDVDAVDADAEVATDEPIGDIEDEAGETMPDSEEGGLEDYEDGMGAEEVPTGEDEMDMTAASDDEVIAVYKKLTGDDEIQIVSNENGDIELTVNEPGEFVIKADGAGEAGVEDMEDMEAEVPALDTVDAVDMEGAEEETYEEGYDMNESQVVYEIAIDEMEDIESVSAPVGNENEDNWAGDNLEGGFDDKGQNNPEKNNHGEHIMEDENVTEGEEVTEAEEVTESEEVTENEEVNETEEVTEEVVEEEETVEENLGSTRGYAGRQGAKMGGDDHHPSRKDESVSESTQYVSKADYDKLLAEAKALKGKAGQLATTLQEQRKMLGKVVVFNTNLTNVVRLFTEHSTTKDEKRNIVERFDDEVASIKESKRLFKTIEKELGNKQPISESVEEKISKEKSGSSSQLNENTAYVDQGTKRIMNLISRVENPDKY